MKNLDAKTEARIEEIIKTLTLEQKVGQMNQTVSWGGTVEMYAERIRRGEIGSMICGAPTFRQTAVSRRSSAIFTMLFRKSQSRKARATFR